MSAQRKSERLLNLLIMLLVQRYFIPKQRIKELLYPDQSVDAFEKMFERDKEELRSLGVPVEVGQMDAYFDDEPGYRIRPDALALPDLELTPEEASVVGLATEVWEHASLAKATAEAVSKLTAQGIGVDVARLDIAQPRLSADEATFDAFWEATQDRMPVTFDYRRSGQTRSTRRHLQPWGVVRHSGRWYAVGFDTDRGGERIFRLSRIRGEVTPDGAPQSFEVPAGVRLSEIAQRLVPERPTTEAVVLARADAASPLRRRASRIEPDVPGPDNHTLWDRLHVPGAEIDELLSLGTSVVVESPQELRDQILARLTALVDGADS